MNPRIDLLRDLVSALRSKKLNRNNFDMSVWAEGLIEQPTLECGYSACAAGLGCSLPSWQKVGFRLKDCGSAVAPEFDGYGGYLGLSMGLGITQSIAMDFFSPDRYISSNPSPLTVANRIRNWIKQYEETAEEVGVA